MRAQVASYRYKGGCIFILCCQAKRLAPERILLVKRFEIGEVNMANEMLDPREAQIFDAGCEMSLHTI